MISNSLCEIDIGKKSRSFAALNHGSNRSIKQLRRLTTTKRRGDQDADNVVNDHDQYSVWEEEIVHKITTTHKNTKIYNESVFGGNNIVCCMVNRRLRCFAGHKPNRLLCSFLLINVPGTVFLFLVKYMTFDPSEYDKLVWVGLVL
jgi:hypothetical protein